MAPPMLPGAPPAWCYYLQTFSDGADFAATIRLRTLNWGVAYANAEVTNRRFFA
jgi:hypothetical protein